MNKPFGRNHLLNSIAFLCMAFSLIAFGGCKTRQKAVEPIVKEEKKTIDKSAPDLQQLISDHSFKASSISAKAAVKTEIGDQSNSFNFNLRLLTDSVIWISISPLLGIEVARVVITRDSVKFLDRLNKKYSVTDFEYLTQLLHVNVDFDILQGVLTGNLFAYKKNKFNSVYLEEKYYILSTLSKRKLKRSMEDVDPNKPIVQDLYVDGQTYRITRLSIEDQRVQKSLLTDYQDHRVTDGGLFPFQSKTLIKAEKEVKIEIEYNKITLNTNPEFPFTIPDGYEKIH
ncbi:MAG TPA: DUF4292 domain-containing protein [Bacteroidia bacterium]|nr:DUF4292 domain-containing protein [Bacteroidia bacterium]